VAGPLQAMYPTLNQTGRRKNGDFAWMFGKLQAKISKWANMTCCFLVHWKKFILGQKSDSQKMVPFGLAMPLGLCTRPWSLSTLYSFV
jgi:hypothetical protein